MPTTPTGSTRVTTLRPRPCLGLDSICPAPTSGPEVESSRVGPPGPPPQSGPGLPAEPWRGRPSPTPPRTPTQEVVGQKLRIGAREASPRSPGRVRSVTTRAAAGTHRETLTRQPAEGQTATDWAGTSPVPRRAQADCVINPPRPLPTPSWP
jgi:hypothetical protein